MNKMIDNAVYGWFMHQRCYTVVLLGKISALTLVRKVKREIGTKYEVGPIAHATFVPSEIWKKKTIAEIAAIFTRNKIKLLYRTCWKGIYRIWLLISVAAAIFFIIFLSNKPVLSTSVIDFCGNSNHFNKGRFWNSDRFEFFFLHDRDEAEAQKLTKSHFRCINQSPAHSE